MPADLDVVWIVDPNFGERGLTCAHSTPVWIVESEANAAFIQRCQRSGRSVISLTTNGPTAEAWLLNHIDTIDQHHNEFSQAPPYRHLQVIGGSLTSRVEAWFREFGFDVFTEGIDGFRCSKAAPAEISPLGQGQA